MRRFIFLGRFVHEKGFDVLFPFFERIVRGEVDAEFDIFGSGPLGEQFLQRFAHSPVFFDGRNLSEEGIATLLKEESPRGFKIGFFGFRSQALLAKALKKADFSVMPSRFLETFGLSALESLSAGVPVVGIDKGGLSQFLLASGLKIQDSWDSSELAKNFSERLTMLSMRSDALMSEWRLLALTTAKRYSKEVFKEAILEILPSSTKRILLVTDFLGNIGGIETYVTSLQSVLSDFGYEVRIIARSEVSWNLLTRVFSTLAAFCNIQAARELHKEIKDFRPEVIWCHSVLRRFGPVGIFPILFADSKIRKMVTYHDLGYFAPSAALIERESDVPPPNFFRFVRGAHGFLGKILAVAKWWKLTMLFRVLARFDSHIVPSPFLQRFVWERLPLANIRILPHFIGSPWK